MMQRDINGKHGMERHRQKEEEDDEKRHLWHIVDNIIVQLERMDVCSDDVVDRLKRLTWLRDRWQTRQKQLEKLEMNMTKQRDTYIRVRNFIQRIVEDDQYVSSDDLKLVRELVLRKST